MIQSKPVINHQFIKIVKNDTVVSDSVTITNAFNNFFANIGKELENKIPSVTKNAGEYLSDSISNSFYIYPTSSIEIESEILKLKTGKAVGPFSVPIDILKLLKSVKPLGSKSPQQRSFWPL